MNINSAGGAGATPEYIGEAKGIEAESHPDGLHPGETEGCSNDTFRPADAVSDHALPDMAELPNTSVHAGGLEQKLQGQIDAKGEIPNLKLGGKPESPKAGGTKALPSNFKPAGGQAHQALKPTVDPKAAPKDVIAPGEWFKGSPRTQI